MSGEGYRPIPIMPSSPEDMAAQFNRELERLSDELETIRLGYNPVHYVAPDKPRDGMKRYADGTQWDPGGGEGLYIYYNGVWNKMSDDNYVAQVALGRRSGHAAWDKFGFNEDVGSASYEVVAEFGGAIGIYTTAETLSVVSTSTADDSGGTGANSLVVYGVDSAWAESIEVLTLDGTTTATTATTFISYPNRLAMFLCGTGQKNAGDITARRTTGGQTVGTIPAEEGVSQQCILTIPDSTTFLADWMLLSGARFGSGAEPTVTFKLKVYSAANNGIQEVLRYSLDTNVEISRELTPHRPFPIDGKSIVWLEVISTRNTTVARARFSGEIVDDLV